MPSLINLGSRIPADWTPFRSQIDCYIELVAEAIGRQHILCAEYLGDYDGKVVIVINIPHHSPYPYGLITYKYGSVGGRDEIGMISELGPSADAYRYLVYRILSAVEVYSTIEELKMWLENDDSLDPMKLSSFFEQLDMVEINMDFTNQFSKMTGIGNDDRMESE